MRRTFTGTTLTQVTAHCTDVSGLVRQIAGDALDNADSTTVPPAVLRVAYEMVRRAIENPHALTQEGTDTVYRWQVAEGNDSVYATDEEEDIIRGAVGAGRLDGVQMDSYLPEHLYYEPFGLTLGDL